MAKMLLFIPMYNCQAQITRVLDQVTPQVGMWFQEVLIVNNRSTDGGEHAVVKRLLQNDLPCKTTLLRNCENYGLGGSHKVAFHYAMEHQYDYVAVLHGDDQGHLEDLLPILESGNYQQYDCCLGARFMRGARLEGYSRFRTFGNNVYNLLFSIVVRRRIYDLGSGLNLYCVKSLESRYYEKFCDNLQFNYCMVLASASLRQKALFFPIRWSEDDQVSNVKLWRQAANVLGILFGYAFAPKRFLKKELREVTRTSYPAEQICAVPANEGTL